jgi:hypothetical protein
MCSLRARSRARRLSRRPRCRGRLSQNRTCAFHIRLVGTTGYDPHRRPVHDPLVPSIRAALHDDALRLWRMAKYVSARCTCCGLWSRGVRGAMTSQLSVGRDRSRSASSATSRGSLLSCCTRLSRLLPPPSPPALSLPAEVALGVKATFRLLSGYCAPVLDLQGHRFARPFVLTPTAHADTLQTSTGKTQQTSFQSRRHYLHAFRRKSGFRCWGPACPRGRPYGASLSLETGTHL